MKRRPWTDEEESAVRKMRRDLVPTKTIAKKLNRTVGSVATKMIVLGCAYPIGFWTRRVNPARDNRVSV